MIVIPIIKPKTELINTVLQIFNRYVVINPINPTLQNSPKALHIIGVDKVIHESLGVVNNQVNIFCLSQNAVSCELVSDYRGVVFPDFIEDSE